MERQVHHGLELLPDVMGRYDIDGNWSVRAFHSSSWTSWFGDTPRSADHVARSARIASRILTLQRTALPCG
jgi:hypothetical protein